MGFFSDVAGFGEGFLGKAKSALGLEAAEIPDLSPGAQNLANLGVRFTRQQIEQLQQLQPFQLAQLGFGKNEQGNIVQLSNEERLAALTPTQRLGEENLLALQQRQGQALRGEISSPGLERDIARERGILQESIARRGQQRGTAEAQRQSSFLESSLIAREQARNQQILQSSQLAGQGQITQGNVLGQNLSLLGGVSTQGIGLIGAGQAAISPFQQQQQMQLQAQQQASANRAQLLGSAAKAAGFAAGGGFG